MQANEKNIKNNRNVNEKSTLLSLSSRSLILPPASIVSVWPLGDHEINTKLWTDGSLGTTIWPGQKVVIKMANCQAHFIILRESYSFYQTLREKLQWAGSRFHYDDQEQSSLEQS